MSEKELLQVARRLGKEWKQVAIYLDLSSKELDEIQATEKDVPMQKLKMLVEWKRRRAPGQATASHLWESVQDLDDLPNEVQQTLLGKKPQDLYDVAPCNRHLMTTKDHNSRAVKVIIHIVYILVRLKKPSHW